MPSMNKFIGLSIVISTTLLIFNKSGKKVPKIYPISEQAESSTGVTSVTDTATTWNLHLSESMAWQQQFLVNNTSYKNISYKKHLPVIVRIYVEQWENYCSKKFQKCRSRSKCWFETFCLLHNQNNFHFTFQNVWNSTTARSSCVWTIGPKV